jgi:hypothetical protein
LAGIVFFGGIAQAQDDARPWSGDAVKAWFTAHPTPDTWAAPAARLMALLELNYKQDGANSFSEPDFREWMDHVKWIQLGLACPDVLAKPENLQTFIALGEDEAISHLLVENMRPENVKSAMLQNIIGLAQANMADLHEYAALGVAYAIVFDKPFTNDWPHSQVAKSAVPIGDLDITKRFAWYVQANRDKKTALDLTTLKVDDLKHLVDSQLSLSELEYGQENTVPYDHFEDAFPSIHYVEARIKPDNMVYDWPYDTYRLADIHEKGGICIDQAYYASEVGKGRGIPTIMFTGEGTDGGHAWFGYLSASGKWELDCGRYINQNFPKGYTLDPQTWKQVNDAALAHLAKGDADPQFQPAQVALAWAQLHQGQPSYRALLDAARAVMPELPEPWEDEADYFDQGKVSVDDQKSFYQDWINQFNSYADMKVEGQERLLKVLKAANDPDADSLQQDIVLQNRSEGFDLGVQGSMSEIEDKFKAQDWEGAKLKFETAVRDFGANGGGTLYFNVVEPYVMMCVQYGQMDQARDGIDFTQDRMGMDKDSQVAIDFENLKKEIEDIKDAPEAMEKWLEIVDSGDYQQAFNASFSGEPGDDSAQPADQFVAEMTRERKPFGKCVSRVASGPPMIGTEVTLYGKQRKGEFYQSEFTVTFDNNTVGKEKVLFNRGPDGQWRLTNYYIHPAKNAPAAASSAAN